MTRKWETILTPYVHPGRPISVHKEHQLRQGLVRRLVSSPALRMALLQGVKRGRRFVLKYHAKDW
jgi:hypothetical protein